MFGFAAILSISLTTAIVAGLTAYYLHRGSRRTSAKATARRPHIAQPTIEEYFTPQTARGGPRIPRSSNQASPPPSSSAQRRVRFSEPPTRGTSPVRPTRATRPPSSTRARTANPRLIGPTVQEYSGIFGQFRKVIKEVHKSASRAQDYHTLQHDLLTHVVNNNQGNLQEVHEVAQRIEQTLALIWQGLNATWEDQAKTTEVQEAIQSIQDIQGQLEELKTIIEEVRHDIRVHDQGVRQVVFTTLRDLKQEVEQQVIPYLQNDNDVDDDATVFSN